jgi:hypothetical protein
MEFTRVNMETLPPIPMLRERMAVMVKPGAERRHRKALRKSSIHIAILQFECPTVGLPVGNYPTTRQSALTPASRRKISTADVFTSGTDKRENGHFLDRRNCQSLPSYGQKTRLIMLSNNFGGELLSAGSAIARNYNV